MRDEDDHRTCSSRAFVGLVPRDEIYAKRIAFIAQLSAKKSSALANE
jgi:hypothetical protein